MLGKGRVCVAFVTAVAIRVVVGTGLGLMVEFC